ncbi:MAG: hypothetical protein VX874_01630 [Pseudomonadota bacterium]|nr:hypothetical protein [Pseudomonadota bacterium]
MSDMGPLATFFGGLDEGLTTAEGRRALLDRLSDDFQWEISLPHGTKDGDKSAFAGFLEARASDSGKAATGHKVMMSTRDGDREVLLGHLESPDAPPSPFVAAATIDGTGLISRLMQRRSLIDI